MAVKIQFFGATWDPDCQAIKKFLVEHKIDYDWLDIEKNQSADQKTKSLNQGAAVIPTLVLSDGTVLSDPSIQELAQKLNIEAKKIDKHLDLAIIGGGPSGLAAAIYTAREDIETVIFEKNIVGGLASVTDRIDNYPGFPEGIEGLLLAEGMEKQAKRFGAIIETGVEVQKIEVEGRYKKLTTSEGLYYAKTVLITTGSDYRKLNVPGEKEYIGRGVHYCATCDGPLYRDKALIVVGGGNAAMQESLFLTKFASQVTLLVRGGALKGSEFLIHKITNHPKIKIIFNLQVTEIIGENNFAVGVKTKQNDGSKKDYRANGIFVFIGLLPNTSWLKGILDLDKDGLIITDQNLQTSIKGVFAAGDVRSGATLQIASAVGEGATAALAIRTYLHEQG